MIIYYLFFSLFRFAIVIACCWLGFVCNSISLIIQCGGAGGISHASSCDFHAIGILICCCY